ncbi:proline-rich protein 23B-like, partial [Tupaia chinensis]|uniref:proline-rich protein 23B-like n=1 Tax=Tupaia chinensis TaxID=246437 RepID=UPI0003C8F7FF
MRRALDVMGSRPRSPTAYPAPWWAPQPTGPSPAKRPRLQEPEGPEPWAAPSLEDTEGAPAADALTSVLVLATGSALQLTLDDVDLLLEPSPSSVLEVSLDGHTLLLVPEVLLGPVDQRSEEHSDPPVHLDPAAFLDAPAEDVVVV